MGGMRNADCLASRMQNLNIWITANLMDAQEEHGSVCGTLEGPMRTESVSVHLFCKETGASTDDLTCTISQQQQTYATATSILMSLVSWFLFPLLFATKGLSCFVRE